MFLLSKNGLTRLQSAKLTAAMKSVSLPAERTRSDDLAYAVRAQSHTTRTIANRTGAESAARGVIFISAKWPRRDGRPETRRREGKRGEERRGEIREATAREIGGGNNIREKLFLSLSASLSTVVLAPLFACFVAAASTSSSSTD